MEAVLGLVILWFICVVPVTSVYILYDYYVRRAWRRDPRHRWLEQLRQSHDDIRERARSIRRRLQVARSSRADALETYRRTKLDEFRGSSSIRRLRDYGASNVRWSALEDAGIEVISQLDRRRGTLEDIPGVGPVSAERIEAAYRRMWESRLRGSEAPTPRPHETAGVSLAYHRARLEVEQYGVLERDLGELEAQIEDISDIEIPHELEALLMTRRLQDKIHSLEPTSRELTSAGERLLDLEARRESIEAFLARDGVLYEWLGHEDASSGGGSAGAPDDLGRPEVPVVDTYASERDFERRFVEPLLRTWGWETSSQHPCEVHLGSGGTTRLYVDQYVRDERGPITIVESKRRLETDRQRQEALEQALSYARHLRFESVVLAAPQGFWLYQRDMYEHWLVCHEKIQQLLDPDSEMRDEILARRPRRAR